MDSNVISQFSDFEAILNQPSAHLEESPNQSGRRFSMKSIKRYIDNRSIQAPTSVESEEL